MLLYQKDPDLPSALTYFIFFNTLQAAFILSR